MNKSFVEMADFVDLDRYPIDRDCRLRGELLTNAQALIDADGCAVLKGFVRAEKIAELVAECDRVEKFGHRNFTRTNPYFLPDREDLASSHPLRRFYDRSNAFVPADNLGADTVSCARYSNGRHSRRSSKKFYKRKNFVRMKTR